MVYPRGSEQGHFRFLPSRENAECEMKSQNLRSRSVPLVSVVARSAIEVITDKDQHANRIETSASEMTVCTWLWCRKATSTETGS